MNTALEHYDAILSHYGNHRGVKIARKHLGWYSKGLPGSAEFRQKVFKLDSPKKVQSSIRSFYEPLIDCRIS